MARSESEIFAIYKSDLESHRISQSQASYFNMKILIFTELGHMQFF